MLFQRFGFCGHSLFLAGDILGRVDVHLENCSVERVAMLPVGNVRRYLGIAFSEANEGLLAEQFAPCLIHVPADNAHGPSVAYRWPIADKRPRSIAYCFGHWWVLAKDEWFGEALYRVDDIACERLRVSETVLPSDVQLLGGSNLLTTNGSLLVCDYILNRVHWLDNDLAVVKVLDLPKGTELGPSYNNEAILCESRDGKSMLSRLTCAMEVAPIGNWFPSPWEGIHGLAMLPSGQVVVLDERDDILVAGPRYTEWKRVVVPWAKHSVTDLIEYEERRARDEKRDRSDEGA